MPEALHVDLHSRDIAWCVRRLGDPVRNLLKANAGRMFVAGGFIRACITGERVADIDLFVPAATNIQAHINTLHGIDISPDSPAIVTTANAVTLKWNPAIQFIHRWRFETPAEALGSFDFTIARAALWYDQGWKGICDHDYYADLAAKRLIYGAPADEDNAGGSFLRLLKFYRRGYRAPLDSLGMLLARIAGQVNAMAFKSEAERATAFATILREIDPAPVHETTAVPPTSIELPDEDEEPFIPQPPEVTPFVPCTRIPGCWLGEHSEEIPCDTEMPF